MKDERFQRAEMIQIKWAGMPPKIGRRRHWRPMYCRMANAGQIYLWPLQIIWRMPWLPHVAHSMGWDACWRQMYTEAERLRSEIASLKSEIEKLNNSEDV